MSTDKGNDRFSAVDGAAFPHAGRGLWDLGPFSPMAAVEAVSREVCLVK